MNALKNLWGLAVVAGAFMTGCASAPEAQEEPPPTTIHAQTTGPQNSLAPEGEVSGGENSDAVLTGASADLEARAAGHACTKSEFYIAEQHCLAHHIHWEEFADHVEGSCQMTSCWVSGGWIHYGYEP